MVLKFQCDSSLLIFPAAAVTTSFIDSSSNTGIMHILIY
jgi:hypothetical protein